MSPPIETRTSDGFGSGAGSPGGPAEPRLFSVVSLGFAILLPLVRAALWSTNDCDVAGGGVWGIEPGQMRPGLADHFSPARLPCVWSLYRLFG